MGYLKPRTSQEGIVSVLEGKKPNNKRERTLHSEEAKLLKSMLNSWNVEWVFTFLETTFNCGQIAKTVGGLNYTYKKNW